MDKSVATMFEIFEGRFDVYPLTVKWVKEWFCSNNFIIDTAHKDRILALINNFDYKVYNVVGDLRNRIDKQFRSLTNIYLQEGKFSKVGFAVLPYLFTWNFQRFKEYFKRRKDFNLEHYFNELGSFLDRRKEKFKNFIDQKLLESIIDQNKVKTLFEEVNDKLKEIGVDENEPVGTIKLLHIFAPFYFPLLDNNIAKTVKLLTEKRSLTSTDYLRWMSNLKVWLQNYTEVEDLEKEFKSSILKLVDEGLYVMSTINLQLRVERLSL
jgi:hypothetical protein